MLLHTPAFAQKTTAVDGTPKILLSARLDLGQPPFAGAVESIQADGMLRIGPFKGKPGIEMPPNGPVAEGLYLGVVRGTWKDLRDATLVRVKVTEVLADGNVVTEVGRGLDGKIPLGKLILLIRPPQATSEHMQALPDIVTLEEGPAPKAESSGPVQAKEKPTASLQVDRSTHNLTSIAKAIHVYKGAYGCFPPAVLTGPDGRPWHSWRVLILPFFGDRSLQAIYHRYAFEEPWDGPRNKELLAAMPTVYTDRPDGGPADTFTRYAAVTGPGTMFAAEGVAFDPTFKPRRIGHGMRQSDLRDDAFTLMVGTLSDDAQVPWTKPEDVVVPDPAPPLNAKESFGTPYSNEKGKYALFARIDGGLAGVFDTIDPKDFRAVVTVAGREGVNVAKIPGGFVMQAAAQANPPAATPSTGSAAHHVKVITIFEENGVIKARLAKQ
jgi:hypothetical protein